MKKVIRYENGLRLISEYVPALRSVAVGIWTATGSARETAGNNGISHFTEHMIFKGTNEYNAFEIADKFESMGASINAFTGKEATCYFFKAVDEYAEECFNLLSHIYFDSDYPAEDLDKERKVILEEINMVEDSPEDICYDLMSRSLYSSHPLGQTILGPQDNVKRFTKADILSYTDEFYCAGNIVVSIAGNMTLEDADRLVRKYFLPKVCEGALRHEPIEKNNYKRNHVERFKDFEQSNIAVCFPSLPFNDKLAMTQAVLNTILGGAMSSRLFQRIREEMGLAYSVYSSPSSFINNGSFNIVVNISACNTAKTLEAVVDEIKRLNRDGIAKEELVKAKTQLKSASVFAQENIQSIMISNGKLLALTDEINDIDKRIKEIDAVTLDGAMNFSRSLFSTDHVCSAYVGKEHGVDIPEILRFK